MSITIALIKHNWLIKSKWTYHPSQTYLPRYTTLFIVLRESRWARLPSTKHFRLNETAVTTPPHVVLGQKKNKKSTWRISQLSFLGSSSFSELVSLVPNGTINPQSLQTPLVLWQKVVNKSISLLWTRWSIILSVIAQHWPDSLSAVITKQTVVWNEIWPFWNSDVSAPVLW